MTRNKLKLIEHAKREPQRQGMTLSEYNSAYIIWHDRYVALTLVASRDKQPA